MRERGDLPQVKSRQKNHSKQKTPHLRHREPIHCVHSLVIEDDPEDFVLLRKSFREFSEPDFQFSNVRDLKTAFHYLDSHTPDLIVLDLNLPDSHGLESFERVHERYPGIPLVVLATSDDDQVALKAIQGGAQDYLVKRDFAAMGPGFGRRVFINAIERKRADLEIERLYDELQRRMASTAARSQISEEKARFQAQLLDSLSESVIATDLKGCIIYWGRGAARLFGLSAEDVLGKPMVLVRSTEPAGEDSRHMQEALDRGFWSGRLQLRGREGRMFWAQSSFSVVRDESGEPCGLISIDLDMTKEMEARQEFERSRSLIAQILDLVPAGIYLRDREGRFIMANAAVAEIYGLAVEDLIGRCLSEIHPDPDAANIEMAEDRQVLESGAMKVIPRGTFRDAQGRRRVCKTTRIPCRIPGTQDSGIFGVFVDVGASSLAGAKADALNETLGKNISEQTLELSSLNDTLQGEIQRRSQLEQELREREDVLAALCDSGPVMIGVVEVVADDILHLVANKATTAFFGLPEHAMNGKTASESGMDREYIRMWINKYRESEMRGRPVSFTYWHHRPDRVSWLSVTVTHLKDFSRTGAFFSYMVIDLTDEKKTGQALTMSEQYNRHLFESSPIGLALCRLDGTLVDVNPAYAAIIGRSVKETLQLTYWDITPRKYGPQEEEQLKKLKEQGEYGPYEKEYIHKDGHLVPVRLSGRIIDRDGEPYIWSSAEDISEKRRIGKALVTSESKYRKLLAASSDAIFLADAEDGIILEANPAAERMLRRPLRDIIGRPITDAHPPEDVHKYREIFEAHVRSGGTAAPAEMELMDRKGNRIPVLVSSSVVDLKDKRYILGIFHNIQDLKRVEDSLEEKNLALRELVAQIEVEKRAIQEKILANVDSLLMPILKRLQRGSGKKQDRYLELLEENLKQLTSSFGSHMDRRFSHLTPKELEICNMIRNGMSVKDIARGMHASPRTIDTHRNNIRKKLGLTRQRINLSTYLKNL